jgi:hypothetical protein
VAAVERRDGGRTLEQRLPCKPSSTSPNRRARHRAVPSPNAKGRPSDTICDALTEELSHALRFYIEPSG